MGPKRGTRLIRVIPALAIGAGALVALAPGASATGTTTTFVLGGGSLSISQPATASMGTVAPGTLTLAHQLGTVTVSDSRGNLTDVWTASVISTNFTTGGASTYETVTNASIAYSSGTATSTSGIGTFTPGVLATMAASGTAGAWAGTSSNTVSWDPTVTFTLSPSQSAGTYTGTITHSVA
ncbi:MAG TPA: hypothetical protein VFZ97_19140 [Acidimicrobiales bacterium]